jgi:hypothetical protein
MLESARIDVASLGDEFCKRLILFELRAELNLRGIF